VSLVSFPALVLAEPPGTAEGFLGLPMWIWQLANLAAFLGVLGYFVARPLAQAFRRRQQAVEDRIVQGRKQREEAARLETEIHERLAQLDRDLADVLARGLAEGEEARAGLIRKADEEGERVRREAEEEIARRLAFAKEELRRTAADLIAAAAMERLSAEITEEDRHRLLGEAVESLPEHS
jgi:F0F1-type ATP synthase membrane subunit b/b'